MAIREIQADPRKIVSTVIALGNDGGLAVRGKDGDGTPVPGEVKVDRLSISEL